MEQQTEQHVIVFGATGGIGQAIVNNLRQAGQTVTAVGRNANGLAVLGQETGCRTAVLENPADFSAVAEVVGSAQKTQPVTGVVNALGSVWLKPAAATSQEDWEGLVALHLSSSFAITRAVAKNIRQACKVLFFSSAAAQVGLPNHEGIAAVKAGIEGLVRSASATYARRQLSFFAIALGMVETPATAHLLTTDDMQKLSAGQHPLGRIGQPEDVAPWVTMLLAPSLQWATGMTLPVDGGLAHLRSLPRK